MHLFPSEANAGGDAAIRDTAANWVIRQDRQLLPAEKRELAAWLAADPRHAAAFQHSLVSWRLFRELGTAVRRAPEVTAIPRPRRHWLAAGGLAAAVAVLAFVGFERLALLPQKDAAGPGLTTTSRLLPDGSAAQLKADAAIIVAYSHTERRIRLVRGEAFFTVAKDPAHPFFVEAGNVTVRAIGTAFAVRFEPHEVDVLVTEGTVQVNPHARGGAAPAGAGETHAPALVDAGHRAVVTPASESRTAAMVVSAVSTGEIERTLAWNQPMLDLSGSTLGELIATFAQRSGRRIEIADPALASVRIGGKFPTDDVDGFVRALEQIYEVKSEQRPDGTLVLRKAHR